MVMGYEVIPSSLLVQFWPMPNNDDVIGIQWLLRTELVVLPYFLVHECTSQLASLLAVSVDRSRMEWAFETNYPPKHRADPFRSGLKNDRTWQRSQWSSFTCYVDRQRIFGF